MNALISLPFRFAPRSPLFYLIFWLIWCTVLWVLSSRPPSHDEPPPIPHFDKILHFGYFACGAILTTGAMINLGKKNLSLPKIVIIAFVIGAFVGAIDEYHQSMVPGRFGNDPWDWIADCLGSIAGSVAMLWGWRKWKT